MKQKNKPGRPRGSYRPKPNSSEPPVLIDGKYPLEDFIPVTRAARILKVSRPTVYALVEKGELRFIRTGTTLIRVYRPDVEKRLTIVTAIGGDAK